MNVKIKFFRRNPYCVHTEEKEFATRQECADYVNAVKENERYDWYAINIIRIAEPTICEDCEFCGYKDCEDFEYGVCRNFKERRH